MRWLLILIPGLLMVLFDLFATMATGKAYTLKLRARMLDWSDGIKPSDFQIQRETWTCHICGDRRPDEKISVRKTVGSMSGVGFEQNVRYCNDREKCAEASMTYQFFEGDQ